MTNTGTTKHKSFTRQLVAYFLLSLLLQPAYSKAQGRSMQLKISQPKASDNAASEQPAYAMGRNILCILQDKYNNYWFGTNGEGVYRYDGTSFVLFTDKEGLCNNQVQSIREDKDGNLWFGTAKGISRFDGQTFTTVIRNEHLPANSGSLQAWATTPDDIWLEAGAGAYRYNGNAFTYLLLPKADTITPSGLTDTISPHSGRLGAYSVYCTLKDRKGNIWFGTQFMGVCRYDGSSFKWLTAKGLAGPAVRGLFEDKDGNLWFGNNGSGLFRYDGDSLINITDIKGLGNEAFMRSSTLSATDYAGTMARVWTISQDNAGVIWIGTIDAGVWRYDGEKLTNYTMKDGLSSNAINIIYKDKSGALWFGTDGAGVCRFNGTSFSRLAFKLNH